MAVPAAKAIMMSIEGNALERGSVLRTSQCLKTDNTALLVPGTAQTGRDSAGSQSLSGGPYVCAE